jgi:hypothetical protein
MQRDVLVEHHPLSIEHPKEWRSRFPPKTADRPKFEKKSEEVGE